MYEQSLYKVLDNYIKPKVLKDFNRLKQSYSITFKEQTNQITGIFDEDFNSFIYEIDGDVIMYSRQVE